MPYGDTVMKSLVAICDMKVSKESMYLHVVYNQTTFSLTSSLDARGLIAAEFAADNRKGKAKPPKLSNRMLQKILRQLQTVWFSSSFDNSIFGRC